MYDDTLRLGRKYLHRYCLQAFSTEKISKRHIKGCLNIISKQRIIMPKKGEHFKFKIRKRLIRTNIKSTLLAVMTIK